MASACGLCLRRSWLLEQLSVTLDYRAGDERRLGALLELPDEELIRALGGRRRDELSRGLLDAPAGTARTAAGVRTLCGHCEEFPAALRGRPGAPRSLYLAGGAGPAMLVGPVVAIVGTARASDYGMSVARELARQLVRAGVTVAGTLGEGIGRAVQCGALDSGRSALIVMAGGVDVCRPAANLALHREALARGCVVSEMPCGFRARRWSEARRERILAWLCTAMIVVEADMGPRELRPARAAREAERLLGAVPGRVGSPRAEGPLELIVGGARLIRSAGDVLELLSLPRSRAASGSSAAGAGAEFDTDRQGPAPPPAGGEVSAGARRLLERIRLGRDSLAKLTEDGENPARAMSALAELELAGLISRGDPGRYVAGMRAP